MQISTGECIPTIWGEHCRCKCQKKKHALSESTIHWRRHVRDRHGFFWRFYYNARTSNSKCENNCLTGIHPGGETLKKLWLRAFSWQFSIFATRTFGDIFCTPSATLVPHAVPDFAATDYKKRLRWWQRYLQFGPQYLCLCERCKLVGFVLSMNSRQDLALLVIVPANSPFIELIASSKL